MDTLTLWLLMKKLYPYLPVIQWISSYKKSYLKGDLSAGLTVGVMLIPQGMAYALIAGLPPVYGLYASIVPPIIRMFSDHSPCNFSTHFSVPFSIMGSTHGFDPWV